MNHEAVTMAPARAESLAMKETPGLDSTPEQPVVVAASEVPVAGQQDEFFTKIFFRGRQAQLSYNTKTQFIVIRKMDSRISPVAPARGKVTSSARAPPRRVSHGSGAPPGVSEGSAPASAHPRQPEATPQSRPTPSTGTVILILPISYVLNVETEDERLQRQHMRQGTDMENVGERLGSRRPAPHATGSFTESVYGGDVFYHSRSTTLGALTNTPMHSRTATLSTVGPRHRSSHSNVSAYLQVPNASPNGHGRSPAHGATLSQSSAIQDAESAMNASRRSVTKDRVKSTKVYLHYVKIHANEKHSIRTLGFHSNGDYDEEGDLAQIMSLILRSVYRDGLKSILVFISPRSGSGDGVTMFNKQVRPILHFSRHIFSVIITTRQHHCEDYIADLSNVLTSDHVVALVGGDGMVHEAVNGVYRRKVALLEQLGSATMRSGNGSGSSTFTKAEHTPLLHPSLRAAGPRCGSINLNTAEMTGGESVPAHADPMRCDASEGPGYGTDIDEAVKQMLPSIATVAAGSACGVAKSLEVLTPARAALALIHNETICIDLMKMDFIPNPDLKRFQENKLGGRKLRKAKERFALDRETYRAYHARAQGGNGTKRDAGQSPFTPEGSGSRQHTSPPVPSNGVPPGSVSKAAASSYAIEPLVTPSGIVYTDPISYAVGAPLYQTRVAFMSASFGVPNEIDRGSESLRWMGNNRFAAYAIYIIMKGMPRYNIRMRYLPWYAHNGATVSKTVASPKLPSEAEFPRCTMRANCLHCKRHGPTHRQSSNSTSEDVEPRRDKKEYILRHGMDENEKIDFDDPTLPWVTVEGDFYTILATNIRDVAQDMEAAPFSHVSDGAIDLIYSQHSGQANRAQFVKFFLALEKGEHIHIDSVEYVKARAVEVQANEGIIMSDGEMMPLGTVRITKLRSEVNLVRSR